MDKCQICGTCSSDDITKNFNKLFSHQDFVYSDDLKFPYHGVINVTNSCTNACPYCFVDFAEDYMTLDTAIQSVDFIIKSAKAADQKPCITFFGGEPLLRFKEVIQPIVEKYLDTVEWTITTNGMLLNEDIIDFFYKNKVSILLSIDGNKETQNRQRPLKGGGESFDILQNIIPYLLLRFPNTVARATVTKESIPEIYSNFLFFKEIGFKQCFFSLNTSEEYSTNDQEILSQQYDEIGLDIYKTLMSEHPENTIKFSNLVHYYNRIYDSFYNPEIYSHVKRCGLGTTGVGISFDGKLIPCQEENSKNSIIIGDIWNGIDETKHSNFLQEYFEKFKKIQCNNTCLGAMRYTCLSSLCPNSLQKNQKDSIFQPPIGSCIHNKAMYPTAMKFYYLLKNNINPYIRNFYLQEAK